MNSTSKTGKSINTDFSESIAMISVAIPTRQRGEGVKPLLRSILEGSVLPDEIVIMDQSTDEATKDAVEEIRKEVPTDILRYFHTNKRGLTTNRNDALNATKGDFILFADDDVTVDKYWIENALKEWVTNWDRGLVLITGRSLKGEEFNEDDLVPSIMESEERLITQGILQTDDVLYGNHFAASRETFYELGKKPWDERLGVGGKFLGAEDNDFAYRILRSGIPVVYEPSVMIIHHPPPRSWRRMRYTYSYGAGAFMAKHFLNKDWAIIRKFLHTFFIHLVKGFKSLLRLQEPECSGRFLAAIGLIVGFFAWTISAAFGRLDN